MDRRYELHEVLVSVLGSRNVYFQEPGASQMQYPAIVYHLDDIDTTYANNLPYTHADRYMVTLIDKDPDSPIRHKVAALPTSAFSRRFVADKLNHTVYNLYF